MVCVCVQLIQEVTARLQESVSAVKDTLALSAASLPPLLPLAYLPPTQLPTVDQYRLIVIRLLHLLLVHQLVILLSHLPMDHLPVGLPVDLLIIPPPPLGLQLQLTLHQYC